jgi:hypothetical protein
LEGFGSESRDRIEDFLRVFLPVERLGFAVGCGDEILDGVNQSANAGVAATFDLASREKGKPTLDLIDPRSMSWSEMKMVTRTLCQPVFDQISFVGSVIIKHKMDLQVRRNRLLDQIQELAELDAPVSWKAAPDDLSAGDIQGGKESGGSMTEGGVKICL